MSSSISASFSLRPTRQQLVLLDDLFAGPAFLRSIILERSTPISSQFEASAFLLTHRRDLEPYLQKKRESSVNLLTQLALDWSRDQPDQIELEFESDCSVSNEQKVFLPINRLGLLALAEPDELAALRIGKKYSSNFRLVKQGLNYSIGFELCTTHVVSQSRVIKSSPNTRPKSKSIIKFSNFLDMFDARVDAEARAGKAFPKNGFDRLQGWPVSGGLPSLGKRR
jgi:hypothetical protein